MEKPIATVECQDQVYRFVYRDSGAGPGWCHGATTIVRFGDQVFLSAYQTRESAHQYQTVYWELMRKSGDEAWEIIESDDRRTREPSPIVAFRDGRVILSTNSAILSPEEAGMQSPFTPELVEWKAEDIGGGSRRIEPIFIDGASFSEHSYRTQSADVDSGELLLLHINDHEGYYWSLMESDGRFHTGELPFPWGDDYEVPESIRICYPQVSLHNREVHLLGVSDIVEPVSAWRDAKRRLTGKEWDYDFRRLFYVHCPDLLHNEFDEWVEIAGPRETCGAVENLDIWVDPVGDAHVLWLEWACDLRLRKEFYPDAKQVISLNHALIRDNQVISSCQIATGGEDISEWVPAGARFHISQDDRLFVFYSMRNTEQIGGRFDSGETCAVENRLVELALDGTVGEAAVLDIKRPFVSDFLTATPRAGNARGDLLDIVGQVFDPDTVDSEETSMYYARVRVR